MSAASRGTASWHGLGTPAKWEPSSGHEAGGPVFHVPSGDSSIGMNVAEQALTGSQLRFDVSADVNETSAVVFHAKTHGGKSGVLIIGGGSPKNFVLQTEPQIPEVLGIGEKEIGRASCRERVGMRGA